MITNLLATMSFESARTRITFSGQNPSGGQKVISGSCYGLFQEHKQKAFYTITSNLKNTSLWSKEWGVQYLIFIFKTHLPVMFRLV